MRLSWSVNRLSFGGGVKEICHAVKAGVVGIHVGIHVGVGFGAGVVVGADGNR